MRLKRASASLLVFGIAFVVLSGLLAKMTFHQGSEYCGSVQRHAIGVSDSDRCDDALSERSGESGAALGVGVGSIFLGLAGVTLSIFLARRRR